MWVKYVKTVAGVPAGSVRQVTEATGRRLVQLSKVTNGADRIVQTEAPEGHEEAEEEATPEAVGTGFTPPEPTATPKRRGRPKKLPDVEPGGFDTPAGQ